MKDPQKDTVFFTSVREVAGALKIKELTLLTSGLQTLRSQLMAAVSVRVDPAEKQTRPLVEFVQACSDCSSVTDLWDYQTSTNIQNLECLVPDIVSLFIRLCTTPILRPFGLQLVQTIMQRHMKSIYRGISSARIPQCISSFRVLAAIASFNQNTARDLFQSFNFQAEGFSRACRYRQSKKGNNPNKYLYDLRTFYVQFVLAFFIHGDSDLKKQVLGVKGLVNGVFNHIDEDAYQLIEDILKASYENIISDQRIPRSLKVSLFSPYTLEKIGKLYARQEPVPIGNEETGIPADLAHHFLLSICTIPGVGVCFKDDGWYSMTRDTALLDNVDKSDQVHNKCLSKFILSLRPSDDMRQQELLLKILLVCPELVQTYWKSTALTLEVRLSSKWLGNAAFLQKVIQLPIPSFYFGTTQLYPTSPPKASTILDNILPASFNRSVSSKGLQHASVLAQFTTSNVLAAAFQKFIKVAHEMNHVISILKQVEDKETNTLAKTKPAMQWRQCLDSVRDEFRRRLPEIQIIIKLHAEVFGKNDTANDDPEQLAQREILQVSVFRLLRFYQECVPMTFIDNHVDPGNLIPVNILAVKPSILVHLLEMLLCLSDFRWSNKSAGTSVSHITTLLTLYLQTPYSHIRRLAARLVYQTLSDSFMFKHDPEEVHLWLESLPRNYLSSSSENNDDSNDILLEEQKVVLHCLDYCFMRFGKAQYRYTDQLAEIVGHTSDAYMKDQGQSDQVLKSIQQSLIGIDVINDVHSDNSRNNIVGYNHPFSPLLLVLLERFKFLKTEKQPLLSFITRLFLLLQTKQKLPIYLHALLNELMETAIEDNDMDVDRKRDHDNVEWIQTWNMKAMLLQIKTCLCPKFFSGQPLVKWKKKEGNMITLSQVLTRTSKVAIEDLYQSQKEFIDILTASPVCQLADHLEAAANYCSNVLQLTSFGPLVDYVSERHPVAGNLFDYPDIQKLSSLDEKSALSKFLKCIPLHIVMYNALSYSGDHALAVYLLEQGINNLTTHQLSCYLLLVLQHLSLLLINNKAGINDSAAIRICFELIQHSLHAIDRNVTEGQIQLDLKRLIFDHPAMKHLGHKLTALFHQLRSIDTYPGVFDTDIVELPIKYVDVFAEGTKALDLLNDLVLVDFVALEKDCARKNQRAFYQEIVKLLVILINNVKSKSLSDENNSRGVAIPSKVFSTVTQIWQHTKSTDIGLSDNDILSLLEMDTPTKQQQRLMDENYRDAQRLLLNACGELVVKHILDGHGLSVDMKDLQAACKTMSIPVSSLIMDRMASTDTLTVPLVELISMSHNLLLNDSFAADTDAYLLEIMGLILGILTRNADASTMSDTAIADDVYDTLIQLVVSAKGFDWTQLDSEKVRDFILTTLLDNLSNAAAIRFTTALVTRVYHQYSRKEPIETYLRRTLGHSSYQSLTAAPSVDTVLTRNRERALRLEKDRTEQEMQRAAIIDFLYILNDIQPAILASQHGLLDTLLTSYGATTSSSDRQILSILRSAERHGDHTILPKLLMWGPGSDKTRQDHAQAGTLLRASTISAETFGLIHREMMSFSFLHMFTESSPALLSDNTVVIYDPEFFLSLFANLISSGTLDCRRFIEVDGLGLTVVALSSLDEHMRKIGYQMMDQFYVLLEHSKFKGKLPIKFLLDLLKHSIMDRTTLDIPPRIPPAVSLCVAQSLSILLLPNHYMLPYISRWMTQKSSLDLNYIPMFTAVFNSTTENHQKERLWILQVLASSIQTLDDYKMYARNHVWDLVISYYNSVLADEQGKQQVMEMMLRAVMIPKVALRLMQHDGLLTWLHQLILLAPSSPSSSSLFVESHYVKSILCQLQSVLNICAQQSDDGSLHDDKVPDRTQTLLSNQLDLLKSMVNNNVFSW